MTAAELSAHKPISLSHIRGYVKPGLQNFYTKLAPEEEAAFQEALRNDFFKDIPVPEILNPKADYDYRGYYQAFLNGDPRTEKQVNENDYQLHYPDTWKTPYHLSFSNESMYASPNAPAWNAQDELVDPRTGEVVFSERNPLALSAHDPSTVPSREASIQEAPPEGLLERLYNLGISTKNIGLPPAKTWPGPDVGLPPPPNITTGKLLQLGLLGLGGMGALSPMISGAIPAAQPLLDMDVPRMLEGMASSAGGAYVGGKLGHVVGGDTGEDVGSSIGGLTGILPKSLFPTPVSESPSAAKIIAIPPVGPLEGTAVLNRQGLAKPVGHGTPKVFPEMEVAKNRNPERLLYGPGHYHSTALENVAEEYAGKPKLDLEKQVGQLQAKAIEAEKRRKLDEALFRQNLPEKDREYFDFVRSEISKPGSSYNETHLMDMADRFSVAKDNPPDLARAAKKYFNNSSSYWLAQNRWKKAQSQMEQLYSGAETPNIRPAYLNIKKPFNIDTYLPKQDVQRIAGQLEKMQVPDPDHMEDIRRFAEDLRQDYGGGYRLVHPDAISGAKGERMYRSLENVLGSRTETNKFLQEAGYDGITHIGMGPYTGGKLRPMPHRVWIAFKDEQVVPYFNPALTSLQEAQLKRAKEAEFKKLIAQAKENQK